MRGRGSSRGVRNNRDWNSKPEHSQQQNGPLMTNHLRDIDIEMEILKRRREMIQQEHALLDRERQFNMKRQYEYEQPSVSYSQPNSSGYESTYYRQQGNKRQAVEKSPPKRFNPPKRVEPWEHNVNAPRPRNNNFASRPQPLLSIAPKIRPARSEIAVRKEFRPATKPAPVVRKDFNPSKITKPKSRTPYLQKPPIVPRDKPLPSSKSDPIVDQDFVLRHDVTPSPQLNGRLELALGSILKDLKQQMQEDPKFATSSIAYHSQRTIKQIIRERIRAVMMDKLVGQLSDIVACYRKKYPVETDAELIKLAIQAQKYLTQPLGITSVFNSEKPKEYFKANLVKLVDMKLDEVFSRLKDIYKTDVNNDKILKHMDNVIDLKTTKENNDGENTVKKEESEKKDEIITIDNSAVEDTEEQRTIKKIAKAKAYSDLMEDLLEQKLPDLLPKFKDIFISMLDADKEYCCSKSKLLEETIKQSLTLVEEKITKQHSKGNRIAKKVSIENGLSEVADIDNKKSDTIQGDVEATEKVSPAVATDNTSKSANQTPVSKIIEYPYYVKLIGRPELPSRAAVYKYLEQFKPASIKKHKTIGNLLVLGFNDKEGYDKILEAEETSIGQNTIIIKANEKVILTPQKPSPKENENTPNVETAAEESIHTEKSQDEANDSLCISADLDDQITSLLTAIRNADEEKTIETPEHDESAKVSVDAEKPINEPEVAKDNSSDKAEPMETISEANEEEADNNLNKDKKNDSVEKENLSNETETNNKDSANVDKHSVNVDKDSANVDKNSVNVDNDSANVDKDSVNVDKDSVNVDKDSPNVDKDSANVDKDSAIVDTKSNTAPENNEESTNKPDDKDPKSNLKDAGRATPTRSSSRLATVTPSSIKTRRASRLAQNN